jgi:helicase required for RNAi-mediated heterochromatin assembly 1
LTNLRLLTTSQCESLIKGDPNWSNAGSRLHEGDAPSFKQWLGKQLLDNKRSFDLETFGYEYEEADLEFEQLKELEAENCAQDDDDDFESLRGHAVSLWDAFVGKATTNVSDDEVRAFLTQQDLYKIPSKFRGAVYNYFQRQAKDHIRAFVREQAVAYDHQVARFRAGGWERDAVLLRKLGIKLIGEFHYHVQCSVC